MLLKIEDNNTKNVDYNFNDKANCKVSKSFSQIFKVEKSKTEENYKNILLKKISESKNVKMFKKILGIDTKKNTNLYLKKNGKIDVINMLKDYGGKLSTNKLNDLVRVLGGLYKEGLIDDEDYFYVLKWIRTKIQAESIKINNERKEFEVIKSAAENNLENSVHHNYEVSSMSNKMKADNTRKKKNVNHNPQAESVKAVFGEPKAKVYDPSDFKI